LGKYFETAALLEAWPENVLRQVPTDADIVIAEPVPCDGQFSCAPQILPPGRALLLDTTMSGPAYDLQGHLESGFELVFAYISGLKLDQAGLELANAGIVRIYAKNESAPEVGAALRDLRVLNGTGLTLDEMSALSAPWFMDRSYADAYTSAIFANNRALATAVGTGSRSFGGCCHPSLLREGANAPFCAITLRHPTPEGYARLLLTLQQEIVRRGLLATQGGSFGFRGHRFELIKPSAGRGQPFLRMALGWRDGYSRQGFCDLFEELSALNFDSID
jgi:hypothetical protein